MEMECWCGLRFIDLSTDERLSIMTETFDDQLSRLEQIAEDEHGETWELTPKDRAAIAAVLGEREELQSAMEVVYEMTWPDDPRNAREQLGKIRDRVKEFQ